MMMTKVSVNTALNVVEAITQIMLLAVAVTIIWTTSETPVYGLFATILFGVVAAWVFLGYKIRKMHNDLTDYDK
jgi:uncharacterized membrane-anchored protein